MFAMIKRVVKNCISLLPIKQNRIVFINFDGKGFGDNPKYICEELLRRDIDLDLIWLTNNLDIDVPDNLRLIKIYSLTGYIALATAKIWVANTRIYKGIKKKNCQYYIQTWHGSCALKKIERDAEENLSKSYIEMAKYDGRITDLMISNSKMQTKEFKTNFWYDGEILECGYPRNDVLINRRNDKLLLTSLKRKLNINTLSKIILYAPTFREDNSFLKEMDFQLLHKNLCKYLGEDCILAVRLHPNVAEYCKDIVMSDGVINVTFYPDMQELLLVADVLITDYSSALFDFALMKKPVIIYATDIEDYSRTRGINEIFYDLSFPVFTDQEKLLDGFQCLLNYDPMIYKRFFDMYGPFDDGEGSMTVGDRIQSIVLKY